MRTASAEELPRARVRLVSEPAVRWTSNSQETTPLTEAKLRRMPRLAPAMARPLPEPAGWAPMVKSAEGGVRTVVLLKSVQPEPPGKAPLPKEPKSVQNVAVTAAGMRHTPYMAPVIQTSRVRGWTRRPLISSGPFTLVAETGLAGVGLRTVQFAPASVERMTWRSER